MKQLYNFIAIAITLAACQPTPGNAEIYKWIDSNGNVQYSDRKPETDNVETKHYQASSPTIDPELERYRQHIQRSELERKREQELAAVKAAEQQEKAKQKKRYCDRLKSKIHTDNNAVGWQTRNPDGSATPWTGEQRLAYTKSLQDNFNKYCR